MVLLSAVRRHGINQVFSPGDARQQVARGLWPGPSMIVDERLTSALNELKTTLVSESYGGVAAAR